MNTMRLSRRPRVLVAWLAALLLVMCQTAFAAQACGADLARGNTTSAAPPCHEATDTDSSVPPRAASACEATKAVADPVKIPVFGISDMPAVIVAIHEPAARVASLAPQHVQAVCYSPHLTVLHCRFLN
jgi:hypothetical protein